MTRLILIPIFLILLIQSFINHSYEIKIKELNAHVDLCGKAIKTLEYQIDIITERVK